MKNNIVRFWHPAKGGWYHATLIKSGRKWARVRALGNGHTRRVSIQDVREVTA